jgi:hypothetical protein
MMPAILRDWSIAYHNGDHYQAPEVRRTVLLGKVYNHPRKSDGTLIISSHIVGGQGKTVFTISGTEYRLENPDPEYVEELKELGYEFDPSNPIKARRRRL